jgi:uncharacterized protein YndB with AHSA1/START domain
MASMASAAGQADYRELVIIRVFDAPRELVFRAWTDPEQFARWWGKTGCTVMSAARDARPGGAHRSCIRSPAGKDYWAQGVFHEVIEPERLVFTFAWDGQDDMPANEMLVTVTFAEEGRKTRLIFRQTPFLTREAYDGHRQGWDESFDKLASQLRTRRTA